MNKKVGVTLVASMLFVSLFVGANAGWAKDKYSPDFSIPKPISQEDLGLGIDGIQTQTTQGGISAEEIEIAATPKPIREHSKGLSPDFTAPKSISQEEIVSDSDEVIMGFEPEFITSPNWKYWDVDTGSYIDTSTTYTLSGMQNVPIKFVQYDSWGNTSVSVGYRLINANNINLRTSEIIVNGSYTDKAGSVSFPSVPAGTYFLRIYNHSSVKISGNGYVFYW
ncbi:hypothetical protein CBW65_03910 [Tumebacillus avium]|uniref:Uncharacterized protein n=1 Tax=Tumebacillus avium TaxID=1903704 RepID=A0A1Y0IIH4_9BACL|nr:hypothetical protein [Tumebacillus avium]ARU60302.1 hypothetical protein CBW65_03910 [Tumebacillus avium]